VAAPSERLPALDVAAEAAPQPYASSREHLLAELARVDAVVQAAVAHARQAGAGAAAPAAAPVDGAAIARDLEQRRAVTHAPLRLELLAARFELSAFELDLVLLGLLPEIDLRYGALFAYLLDDATRHRPSLELALSLFCATTDDRLCARERLRRGPLVRHGLVELGGDGTEPPPPLPDRTYKIDDRIVDHLLHDCDQLDARLSPYARVIEPQRTLDELVLPPSLSAQLDAWSRHDGAGAELVYLAGAYGVGRKSLAEALCRGRGRRLVVVRGSDLMALSSERRERIAQLALREARLLDGTLLWEGFDPLLSDEHVAERRQLLHAFAGAGERVFVSGEATWEPAAAERPARFVSLALAPPSAAAQLQLWRAALADDALADDVDLDQLVARHRMSGGRIADAAATARDLARVRAPTAPRVSLGDLFEASRRHGQPRLGQLARAVTARPAWDDLVLSRDRLERLREICNQARHRRTVLETWGFEHKLATGKGLAILFSGGAGTGKTLSASVLANELGLSLYQIDLASVVSKYIGETEKQLCRLFDEAESSRAILFFDEADALFGKRTEVRDAHDRYANIETSYLLQRMDSYEGVVILATNLSRNMDDAFLRRLQFVIEFGLPDERERLQIWQRVWPAALPRDPSVDLPALARRFDLSGGHIRNIVLAAAFLAAADGGAVAQRHLLHATRRELQKSGKIVDEALFR
jgi:SpoVK/Ycf46/Vps4 family AAA+-type ATPase